MSYCLLSYSPLCYCFTVQLFNYPPVLLSTCPAVNLSYCLSELLTVHLSYCPTASCPTVHVLQSPVLLSYCSTVYCPNVHLYRFHNLETRNVSVQVNYATSQYREVHNRSGFSTNDYITINLRSKWTKMTCGVWETGYQLSGRILDNKIVI